MSRNYIILRDIAPLNLVPTVITQVGLVHLQMIDLRISLRAPFQPLSETALK